MDPRRTVLTLLIVGLVPAFAATNALVGSARARRQALAVAWADQGERDLAAGQAAPAAEAFRTAMEYSPDRSEYRRQRAVALLAADRPAEARSQLLTLWSATPGDGAINRDLGRVAARQGDIPEAIRYYHGAVDGAWAREAATERRQARTELATVLLAHDEKTQAQAELIALAGDLPPDPALMTEVGRMLLEAGGHAQALEVIQRALDLDPDGTEALRLAGTAAFTAGDFGASRRHLRALLAAGALDAEGRQMLNVSTRVLALDPFSRGISSRERLRRVLRAYRVAGAALARCADQDALDPLRSEMEQRKSSMTERKLAADPDIVDGTVAFVIQVIDAVAAACGPGVDDEHALQLILHQQRST
jgi:predicted Zn-dependent protease